jgi:glycosyltransferase involved in cell wall biosynthesis
MTQRVALLTPLPPAKSGVAHYSSLLLPALQERVAVTAFGSPDGYDPAAFERVIYQLGNNPYHEWIYAEAMRRPDVIVLHDLVLHHLIVEMTLARGDAEGYVDALRASHGAAGEAWARGRTIGLHHEIGNFLLPASVEVAQRARAVIVHNQWSAARLRSFGVTTPIHVVPHPYVPESRTFDRDGLRQSLGLTPAHRVIGLFGFLTSAKRAEIVLEAFREARAQDDRLALLIVGEPAPNIDVAAVSTAGVVLTGYVADADFPAYYAAADRLVNLRYPSAGETSGTLIRAFDAGKPVAVSDYAQFAELPDSCVVKVPFGQGELAAVVDFFLRDLPDPAPAQRAWLEANARLDLTIDGYLRALAPAAHAAAGEVRTALPLFPSIEVLAVTADATTIALELRNDGPVVLRGRIYGELAYRLIAKIFDGDRVVQDRWLELPGDVQPGATASVTFPRIADGDTLRLYHAMQDMPMLEPDAFAEVRLVR